MLFIWRLSKVDEQGSLASRVNAIDPYGSFVFDRISLSTDKSLIAIHNDLIKCELITLSTKIFYC